VRGTRRTSSPVVSVADRGANAGRDGRACGEREEGHSAASQAGEGERRERRMGAWGLAPTGGRRSDRVPADCDPGAARVGGASLFRTGARRGS
jgi:hypothetical protein